MGCYWDRGSYLRMQIRNLSYCTTGIVTSLIDIKSSRDRRVLCLRILLAKYDTFIS